MRLVDGDEAAIVRVRYHDVAAPVNEQDVTGPMLVNLDNAPKIGRDVAEFDRHRSRIGLLRENVRMTFDLRETAVASINDKDSITVVGIALQTGK